MNGAPASSRFANSGRVLSLNDVGMAIVASLACRCDRSAGKQRHRRFGKTVG
jgi:hypothetical protein